VNLTTENTEDTEFFWRNWDCGGAWFRAGDFMPQGRNRIKATPFIQDKNAGTNQKMNAMMNDTPETNAAGKFWPCEQLELVDADFARRLERERNEALMDRDDGDMAIMTRNHYERILKERDEAIRQFENLKAAAIHTCHDQCQRPMCVLRRERDKAMTSIEDAKRALNATDYEDILLAALRVKEERDEARAELAYREAGHHCDSHRDMMGDCIVCSMEEKK